VVSFLSLLHSSYSTVIGHAVTDIRLIFRVVPDDPASNAVPDHFLTYVQRFDVVPQVNPSTTGRTGQSPRGCYPEPNSSLYILKRAKRADTSIIGDIVPLHQLRALVDLTPCFGETANRSLTSKNSTVYSSEYFLNKYFDKEMFWALNSSK